MPREFRQGDRVTLDTGRHQFNGVIKHVSTINNNPVPYTVEFTDENGKLRTRNCSRRELIAR